MLIYTYCHQFDNIHRQFLIDHYQFTCLIPIFHACFIDLNQTSFNTLFLERF
ncbi:MAG: hypothetical protein ACI935_001942 [Moritella dasanensis]|jgi:hypothetical protein